MCEDKKDKKHMRKIEFCDEIKKCESQLFAVAFAILSNEADAQDAVCSAIQKAYEKLEQLRNPKKFKAWMVAITRNEALQLRRKRVELPGDEKLEAMLEPTVDSYDELWDVVQRLPEEYRIVIVLYYYNELSIREIAAMLEVATGTVKSRMSRGRNILREALDSRVVK